MKCLLTTALAMMTLFTGEGFATETPAPTQDPFFKEPTDRSVMLETLDGTRIKATISHQDVSQLKLKPGVQFELFSIEPYRKIWINSKDHGKNSKK